LPNRLGNWDDDNLIEYANLQYNEVWGYAADGREYALLGSARFIHILDITDPTSITEIARLNTFNDSRSIWRDIKVLGNYAYCVADERAEGLQIIDLSDLPNSATIVYQSTSFFEQAHNIFIDPSTNRLYALGADTRSNGVIVLDLTTPTAPALLASVNLPGFYVHDAYAKGNLLYANHGNNGLFVYDVNTPTLPAELGRLDTYPEQGYNHSCWLTENGNYLVFCDETHNTGVKIADVSNPIDIMVTDVFRSTLLAPAHTNSVAHNPYVLGDSLVVISYYHEGIQVWDISDPNDVVRRGYYDTHNNNSYFSLFGAWGAYPWLPSGRILGSDDFNGLFVLELQGFSAPLPVVYRNWTATVSGVDAQLEWSTSDEENNAGFWVEHSVDGRVFHPIHWVAPGPHTRNQYSFRHKQPGQGRHFYRLRQIDFDGVENLSEVRSAFWESSSVHNTVWPNPAVAGQNIYTTIAAPLTLYDSSGRSLHR
ncbi:MAG: choice-of-anchor B family protein, partial [Bacteroidota bacterium]